MEDLAQAIPVSDHLLEMQPEELAVKLLFVLQQRLNNGQNIHLHNSLNEFSTSLVRGVIPYPREQLDDIKLAITEAWYWLQAQGMIIPVPDANGANGFCTLSRRARSFEDETQFAQYIVTRLLPKDALHPQIRDRVWSAFLRGEFDVAVFQAAKGVEVAVRNAGGYEDRQTGVPLMRIAFHKDTGALSDREAQEAEREALMHLFSGFIGTYKNPGSHRDVNYEEPRDVVEIILFASHLIQIATARAAAG